MSGFFQKLFGKKNEPSGPSLGGKMVKVAPGETLAKIAQREYGDAGQWERIYEANKWKLEENGGDQNAPLAVGMDLKLP